jgi:uncharacterized protein (DUF58 family)
MKNIFLQKRLFYCLFALIVLFVVAYFVSLLYYVAWVLCLTLLVAMTWDGYQLFIIKKLISGSRNLVEVMSLGDVHRLEYTVTNDSDKKLRIEIIDELPFQLQFRDPIGSLELEKKSDRSMVHSIRPLSRGIYRFGHLYAFLSNPVPGLIQWRVPIDKPRDTKVYPSVIQMKKYALATVENVMQLHGLRKVRKIGENDEFEQIRKYVVGDHIKAINWKATSKGGDLMVNQYQDTRSQFVYSVIDCGRNMEMPFHGLSLLDHSINSALVISNIILQKYDYAGLFSFSNMIHQALPADNKSNQLENIFELLYDHGTDFKESDFRNLYYNIRKRILKRSIIFLYTNFENEYELERNFKYLKLISKNHLLVVISFINTEIFSLANSKVYTYEDIYKKVTAQSALLDKEKIFNRLRNHNIQVILTKPEDLNVMVINKYLEIKAKRMG